MTSKFNEEFEKCETEFEKIVLTSGELLGTLGKITAEPFDSESAAPNTWPRLLVEAIERVSRTPDRGPLLSAWLDGASKIVRAMHRAHGVFAPN